MKDEEEKGRRCEGKMGRWGAGKKVCREDGEKKGRR